MIMMTKTDSTPSLTMNTKIDEQGRSDLSQRQMMENTVVDDAKRDELRAKIEAGEQRQAERTIGDYARDATETTTNFVKDHPVAAIAGVAALGLLIGAMTKPGRRAGRAAGRRASAIAGYAGELGAAYASGLADAAGRVARSGGDTLEDVNDTLSRSARSAQRSAAHRAGDTADSMRYLSRKAARNTGRSLRGVASFFDR